MTITFLLAVATLGCGDELYFERNTLSKYTPFRGKSTGSGRTDISTPALDLIVELEKKGFGSIKYDGELDNTDVLMLYAYKSSLNLHIYKVCSSKTIQNYNITGPIIKNHQMMHGYHIDVVDFRLARYLYSDSFVIFGDTDLLRDLSGHHYEKDTPPPPPKKIAVPSKGFDFGGVLIVVILAYIFRNQLF